MQPDGYVKIKDRSKDVIISGGENICSLEVEDVLYRHPAVLAAAVVAQPDAKWGETPCAFVELKPGASVDRGGADRALPRRTSRASRCRSRSCSASCRRRRPARSRNSCCASACGRRRRSSDAMTASTAMRRFIWGWRRAGCPLRASVSQNARAARGTASSLMSLRDDRYSPRAPGPAATQAPATGNPPAAGTRGGRPNGERAQRDHTQNRQAVDAGRARCGLPCAGACVAAGPGTRGECRSSEGH